MFLKRWYSPIASDGGGMGPRPLPLSHSSSAVGGGGYKKENET